MEVAFKVVFARCFGAYSGLRFTRCLDLYLCPRALKMRMNVDPQSLLPQLPNPKDLRPFPTQVRTLPVTGLVHLYEEPLFFPFACTY